LQAVKVACEWADGVHPVGGVTASKVQEVRSPREPAIVTIHLAVAPRVADSLETNEGGVWHVEGGGGDGHGGLDRGEGGNVEVLVDTPLVGV